MSEEKKGSSSFHNNQGSVNEICVAIKTTNSTAVLGMKRERERERKRKTEVRNKVDLDGETFINCPKLYGWNNKQKNRPEIVLNFSSINHSNEISVLVPGWQFRNRKMCNRTKIEKKLIDEESLIIFCLVSCVPCDVLTEIKCACSPSQWLWIFSTLVECRQLILIESAKCLSGVFISSIKAEHDYEIIYSICFTMCLVWVWRCKKFFKQWKTLQYQSRLVRLLYLLLVVLLEKKNAESDVGKKRV